MISWEGQKKSLYWSLFFLPPNWWWQEDIDFAATECCCTVQPSPTKSWWCDVKAMGKLIRNLVWLCTYSHGWLEDASHRTFSKRSYLSNNYVVDIRESSSLYNHIYHQRGGLSLGKNWKKSTRKFDFDDWCYALFYPSGLVYQTFQLIWMWSHFSQK